MNAWQADVSKLLDRYISLKEAAMVLGVSYPTLKSYIRDGRLNEYRVGNSNPKVKYSELIQLPTLMKFRVDKYQLKK